jgi:hypothetical protein
MTETLFWIGQCRWAHILKKSRSQLEIPVARWITRNKLQTDDQQTWGATLQNVVATATWRPGFVYACDSARIQDLSSSFDTWIHRSETENMKDACSCNLHLLRSETAPLLTRLVAKLSRRRPDSIPGQSRGICGGKSGARPHVSAGTWVIPASITFILTFHSSNTDAI